MPAIPRDRVMEDVRIVLAGLWVALMLTYLLGDVLRFRWRLRSR